MKVLVIGSGQMGRGIAQVSAQARHEVLLYDINPQAIERALRSIQAGLASQLSKGRISPEEMQQAVNHLTVASGLDQAGEADLIIEAATEVEAVKNRIFEQVCTRARREAILASNTSSIPITRLASLCPDPTRFIGLHFFNPVPVMGLVEVIPGLATDPRITAECCSFVRSLGKEFVIAGDDPGFVVNRILVPMINEAIFVLGSGMGSIEDIDKGCRIGLNHPMGPLQLADLVGLDTLLEVVKVLVDTTGDSKYRPAPLLVKYVEAGWIGKKAGRGFYDYSGPDPLPTR